MKNFILVLVSIVSLLTLSDCSKEETPPTKPLLVSPSNFLSEADYALKFAWTGSSNSTFYNFELSSDNAFLNNIESVEALGTTEFSVKTLIPATTYFWRVRAKNSAGLSAWSESFQFTTKVVPKPNLVSPADKSIVESITQNLQWGVVPLASEYKVQASEKADFSAIVLDACLLSNSTLLNNLQPNKTYFWRVKSVTQSIESEWSSTWSFSVKLPIPTNGLVLHMPFNGNANDLSGFGNNGTITGGVTATTDRKNQTASAYFFDGTGAIDIPTLNNLPYKPITYSVWVIVKSYYPLSAGNKFRAIIGRQLTFNTTCGMLGFYGDQNVSGGAFDNSFLYWMGGASIPDVPYSKTKPIVGEWTHLVFTQDADGKFTFFINGVQTNSGNLTNVQNANIPFRIGYCENTLSERWNDKIDDVRIYNRVLNDREILALYLE